MVMVDGAGPLVMVDGAGPLDMDPPPQAMSTDTLSTMRIDLENIMLLSHFSHIQS